MCGSIFRAKTPSVQKINVPSTAETQASAPAPTPTAPSATEIRASEESNAVGQEVSRAKKKRGYASTRTSTMSSDTIASSATGKQTLG